MMDGAGAAVFCSDLDGTLLGEAAAAREFARCWEGLRDRAPLLIYSTGRLVEDARRVITEAGLPQPDYYIGGVGTMIWDVRREGPLSDYASLLSQDWDRQRAVEVVQTFPAIREQPAEQQHAWKSSWFWEGAGAEQIEALRQALDRAGVQAQVIYSTGRDLDVLPTRANKGNALRWLMACLGRELSEVVVAGDSGNDASMFEVAGVRGIVPGNVAGELLAAVDRERVFHAGGRCAAGILEGLRHYGVLPPTIH